MQLNYTVHFRFVIGREKIKEDRRRTVTMRVLGPAHSCVEVETDARYASESDESFEDRMREFALTTVLDMMKNAEGTQVNLRPVDPELQILLDEDEE